MVPFAKLQEILPASMFEKLSAQPMVDSSACTARTRFEHQQHQCSSQVFVTRWCQALLGPSQARFYMFHWANWLDALIKIGLLMSQLERRDSSVEGVDSIESIGSDQVQSVEHQSEQTAQRGRAAI